MAEVPLDIAAQVRGADPARPDDVTTVRGQVEVATTPGMVESVELVPADPPACAEAIEGNRGRRLGDLGAGIVVHQCLATPAGAGAAGRLSRQPRPGAV